MENKKLTNCLADFMDSHRTNKMIVIFYFCQMSRERLNSEGLMSPGDECSLELQHPSPVTLEA